MPLTLHYKLFGAILAAILLVVAYMTMVFQWSFDRGFLRYVNTVERVQLQSIAAEFTHIYKEERSWIWAENNPQKVAEIIIESYPEGSQKARFLKRLKEKKFGPKLLSQGPLPTDPPVHFVRRVFLLDAKRTPLIGFGPNGTEPTLIPIYFQNRTVGYLGAHPAKNLSDSHQLIFVQQQKLALFLVALATIFIAAGLSFPLAYKLTKPIRQMARGTRELASGRYSTRISGTSGDELGQLAGDLNDLAATLEKNRIARSQWIADISHELRTPLAILRGKIEGLQDKVYKPTDETFNDLHREVHHLGLLVDDLYQLSLSDIGAMSYNKVEIIPLWALQQALSLLEKEFSKKQLDLKYEVNLDDDLRVLGDNERLKQLFINLLTNSIRYTEERGEVSILVENNEDDIKYIIKDSAPGVPQEHISKLFERFYRTSKSRSRKTGGAGLGLSICRNIVEAHNGSIKAGHSSLGGLQIEIKLPILQ